MVQDFHIDDFYRDTAKILILLYKHFPRKQLLFVEDISGPDTPDEFGLHTERHLACLQTMIWLGDEQWIRFHDLVRQEAVEHAVLTQKTFLLLSTVKVPSQLTDPGSSSLLISRYSRVSLLAQSLQAGDSLAIRMLMRALLADAMSAEGIVRQDLDGEFPV